MLAAVAQICSRGVVADNLAVCASVVRRAAQAGAKLIWLPEASDYISTEKLMQPLASSSFVTAMRDSAKAHSIWVGVGVHESTEDPARCYNSNLLIDPTGKIVQVYRKLHLFDVDIKGGATILESKTTIPGKELLTPIDTAIGKVGLLTCYDLRFPEVSLSLTRQGAQLITYPSAFTLRTGAAHWEVLLRARAIETQCYVLAPAQVGSHSETRHSYGHAMIVDPWGDVIAQAHDRQPKMAGAIDIETEGTFVMANIDLDWLKSVREGMPLWEQRRTDIYPIL